MLSPLLLTILPRHPVVKVGLNRLRQGPGTWDSAGKGLEQRHRYDVEEADLHAARPHKDVLDSGSAAQGQNSRKEIAVSGAWLL